MKWPVVLLVLMLDAAGSWEVSAQRPGERLPWKELARMGAVSSRQLIRAPSVTVVESEPNNTFQTAQWVTLRDTVEAAINSAGDVDFFVFDVPANTALTVEVIAQRDGLTAEPRAGSAGRRWLSGRQQR